MRKIGLLFIALTALVLCVEVDAFSLKDCIAEETKNMIAKKQVYTTSTFARFISDDIMKQVMANCLRQIG
uniref:Putative secreted protein n=1 Tax=Corethrella appendiculata TaxID=1370023 RepID=U5EL60_9DIPT